MKSLVAASADMTAIVQSAPLWIVTILSSSLILSCMVFGVSATPMFSKYERSLSAMIVIPDCLPAQQ